MKLTKELLLVLMLIGTLNCFAQNSEINKLVNEGIEFHDKGEYEKAITVYNKALKLEPNSSLVNYEISFSYFNAKDYKNAEKYSKKVLDLKSGNLLAAYVTYGNSLDMIGKQKKAIKVYEKAMKDFDSYQLYYNHAVACLNANYVEKAYESALKSIENNSAHASSHLVLSKIMARKGSRIKAMLPLYFFLLIEPNSNRASIEYQTLRDYLDHGVSRTSEKNIDVLVPSDSDPNFGAAEMMISLSKASNSLEENNDKSELELFADNNENIFKVLGELKNDNSGFWWDFYVPFFYDMANENLIKSYSYYISLSQGVKAAIWIDENAKEFEKFKKWMGN